MKQRFFQLDTEWNVIHYPEKPNGFGILVLGDEGHFVKNQNSFWLQHIGRNIWLKDFKKAGYTVFCSNLYGNHWGSEKAKDLGENLYHHVSRHEILNPKIHIIAEGMGALLIPALVKKLKGKIRSIAIINPYFSIKEKVEEEVNHIFFYKKFLHEIEKQNPDYDKQMTELTQEQWVFPEPLKIFFVMEGKRMILSKKKIEELIGYRNEMRYPTSVRYILPERRTNIAKLLIKMFQEHEEL